MKKNISLLCILILSGTLSFAEVKHADKAGTWYPSSSSELSGMLEKYLDEAHPKDIEGDIIGIISPHAGYFYSAPVAAYGYKLLEGRNIKTAVVVGFNHNVAHDGIAVFDYDAFSTPLGEVPVNKDITDKLIAQHKNIYKLRNAFYDEQSTELQIPFLSMVLKDFSVVVVSIGNQTLENCNILSDALYEVLKPQKDFVIIASTDMCHYLSYDENNKVDEYTISAMSKFDPIGLYTASSLKNHHLMCGYGAVCAVMMACKKLGADRIEILRHANSGDVSLDRRKVVGYLSAVMIRSKMDESAEKKDTDKNTEMRNSGKEVENMLSAEQKQEILKLARDTIMFYLKEGKVFEVKDDSPILNTEMGAFVTLHKNGRLRGCIGNIIGRGPFYLTVRDMAIESATGDPRFMPVTLNEMKDIDIEISSLSPLEKITDPEKVIPGTHGVVVRNAYTSGVYLPQVATETGWNREQFMNSLCGQKAGMPEDAWKKGKCDIFIFTAEVFGEKD